MMFLNEQEREQITQAIKQAEKLTSCEIVVTEIAQCDDYKSARYAWGILWGLLGGLIVYLFVPYVDWQFILAEVIGFFIGFTIASMIPAINRFLVSKDKMADEVHNRALAEFYQQGLYKTKEENGILIMLAVFEKMVVVLGDKGVNAKVSPDYWHKMKDQIIEGIKHNRAGMAIAEAIKANANELKAHFPYKSDDKDELPDTVVTK